MSARNVMNASSKDVDPRNDPFEIRTGKTLTWTGVNMTLAANKKDEERKLLDNVWGEVPSKQTTAIMGPSGAGKSSLLNILSGRAKSRGKLTITSDIRLNNYQVDPTNIKVRKQIAFVAQDDSLQVTATPREAIRFSAKLRLPRTTTEEQLDSLTKRMIEELGLMDCADTIVGGLLLKGLSGGERKRTSVGVELVTKPALVFLDEPTSGLDSYTAVQLCQVLKKVANAGSSVLFTIHQPSSQIFNSFDHLILLNKGRVMYQGSVSKVPTYFAARNHPNPPKYNPADWIMNVAQSVSIEQLDKEGFFPKDKRKMGVSLIPSRAEGRDALGITVVNARDIGRGNDNDDDDSDRVGIPTQISLLLEREVINVRRDPGAAMTKILMILIIGILIGTIFWGSGRSDSSVSRNVQSRFGALAIVIMIGMFNTAQPALLTFPQERPVFLREYSTNHFSLLSYVVSKLIVEALVIGAQVFAFFTVTYFMIDFQGSFGVLLGVVYALAMASTASAIMVGSASEDPQLANEMLPLLLIPQVLFAGFFVVPDLMPSWLRWPQYLCSLAYTVRLGVIEEFNRDCGSPEGNELCEGIYTRINAEPEDTLYYWGAVVLIFIIYRIAGLCFLKLGSTKFY